MTEPATDALARVVREEWGRLIALLLAQYRRLDLVEDALADAVEAAARTWPRDGAPDNPAGWLSTVAKRRIVDRFRSEAMAARKEPLLIVQETSRPKEGIMVDDGTAVRDDVLRLVLMCTHPALAPDVAAALALRLVIGVPTPDIARLFLVSEPTMAARITRGKKKIVGAGIPFAMPSLADLPSRLTTVAHVAYLAFTAGYAAGSGPDLQRTSVAGEAIRLVRVAKAASGSAHFDALLALMLLQHSRRDARVDAAGDLVLLPDQDRARWHHEEIAEAAGLLSLTPDSASPEDAAAPDTESHRVQALIAAEHALAPRAADTRWDRIVRHYDLLRQLNPSPAVALARAVAVAEAEGPDAGLAALADLDANRLPGHRLPAVRAELLKRAGRTAAARTAYEQAITLCDNEIEVRFLTAQRAGLDGD